MTVRRTICWTFFTVVIYSPQMEAADIVVARKSDGRATVSLHPIRPAFRENRDFDALNRYLRHDYPKWTFRQGGKKSGEFRILQYEPFINANLRGVELSLMFDDGVPTAPNPYNWIQVVWTTKENTKKAVCKIDSKRSNFPFYGYYNPVDIGNGWGFTPIPRDVEMYGPSIWLNEADYPQQPLRSPTGKREPDGPVINKDLVGDLIFHDEPYHQGNYNVTVLFELYLVSFNWNGRDLGQAAGTVFIHGGIQWGYDVRLAR